MTERSAVDRCTEDLRKDFDAEVEALSRANAQRGASIAEKPDWREYASYVAIGTVAGWGLFTSGIFRTRINTPKKRITESIPEKVRDSLGGMLVGTIKMALLGIATKATARWLNNKCRGIGRNTTEE
jgi:hypothetical protein